MNFAADERAERVLTGWISLAGVAVVSLIGALAGLLTPWLMAGAAVVGLLTVAAALVYPPLYAGTLKGRYDGQAVYAVSGVLLRREIYVPMAALRTFELSSTPLQRRFGCRTVVLRFAGGSALLPLLPAKQAEELTALLERDRLREGTP